MALVQDCRQRDHQQRDPGEREQRAVPADARNQRLHHRQQRELAERSGRRRNPERHAALFRRIGATEHARDDGEREPREAGADQHAGGENQHHRRRRQRHRREPCAVEERAGQRDAMRAEPVGEHSGERRGDAPHDVLHGDGQRERLATPMEVGAHRLQEEPEAVADAHRQHDHDAARDEHDGGRSPVGAHATRRWPRARFHGCRSAAPGCSDSMAASVAMNASRRSAPSAAATSACAFRQWGRAARMALLPARVSATSRVRASSPRTISTSSFFLASDQLRNAGNDWRQHLQCLAGWEICLFRCWR